MSSRRIIGLWAALWMPLALASTLGAGDAYLGKEFPDFSAKDAITDQEFSLRDLRGKVVLIDFWATWCGPCVAELPNVKKVYRRYERDGLEIVSISLDNDRQRFRSFVRTKRMDWYHVMEGGGWKTRLARKYGVRGIPRMLVLDPDGICIADGVRGHGVEAAIRKGLAKVASSEPDGQDPPEEEPIAAQTTPADIYLPALVATRETLSELAAPMRNMQQRLDSLDVAIDELEEQLPNPDDPSLARRQVASVHEELTGLRQEMFMLGLLDDERTIGLPADPLETGRGTASARWTRVIPMLHAARLVVQQMREGAAGVGRQLDRLENDIRRLEHGISRSTGSGESITASVDEVQVQANEMAERLSDPWLHQLEPAERRIRRVTGPLNEIGARLDGIDERIRAVGEVVDTEPRDTSTLIELRDLFRAVCKDIQEAAHLVDGGDEGTMPLPGNPFEDRRLRDRRVLVETKAELGVAIDAADRLRTRVDEQRSRFDRLDTEARALQREVSERLESGGDLSDLRERFEHLCREILRLDDSIAGA